MQNVRVAFSGSGFLAPIHAGAVCGMLDSEKSILEVAGTSGGSIAAALVACGYSSSIIKSISLEDLPSDIIPDGVLDFSLRSLMHNGLSDGSVLLNWLHEKLGDVTFAQAKIPITIMATDIQAGMSFKFSAATTPNIPLYQACSASASVPFVYAPYQIGGMYFCDGGMCCNLPINQLVMDSAEQIGIEVMDGSPSGDIDGWMDFSKQCIKTMLASNEANLEAWGEMFDAKIIQVDAAPYGFLNAKLPLSAKTELFNRGYKAAQAG